MNENDNKLDLAIKKVENGEYKLYLDGRCKSRRSNKCVGAISSSGYYALSIWHQKKDVVVYLHRLFYRYFKGPIPKGFTVNHIDGNKLNNNINNLETMTLEGNIRHAHAIGLYDTPAAKQSHIARGLRRRGENSPVAKLTNKQAADIREAYKQGDVYQCNLAEQYGVDPSTISLIVAGKIYKGIEGGDQ